MLDFASPNINMVHISLCWPLNLLIGFVILEESIGFVILGLRSPKMVKKHCTRTNVVCIWFIYVMVFSKDLCYVMLSVRELKE